MKQNLKEKCRLQLVPNVKKKTRFFRNLILILAGLLLAGIFVAIFIIFAQNKVIHTNSFDVSLKTETLSKSSNNAAILFEIPRRADNTENSWYDKDSRQWGAQYDIYVINKSKALLTDWSLKIYLPEDFRIDSSWNGVYKTQSAAGKKFILATGIESALNVRIAKGELGKLGFVLYTPHLLKNCNFELTYRLEKSAFSDPVVIVLFCLLLLDLLTIFIYYLTHFMLEHQKKHSESTIQALIQLVSHFIDVRDPYTREHSSHVGKYSRMIAERMGFSEEDQRNIYCMGLLHDVGKVLIPSEILKKTEKLTDEEWQIMKKHTTYGAEILKSFEYIPYVKEAVLYHHERYDGSGYMSGLKGEEIPLVARIICVADSYDAMATDRAYRNKLPREVILSEIEKNKGKQFDPEIASIMVDLIKEGKI